MSKSHPGARRTHHERDSDPDDIFLAKVLGLGKWASANQQLITVFGIIAVILVAGIVYYRNYQETLAGHPQPLPLQRQLRWQLPQCTVGLPQSLVEFRQTDSM